MKKALIGLLLIAAAVTIYLHKDITNEPTFAKSENCESCHSLHFEAWKHTLHPYQFRPVEKPEDILGDFESDNPALTFEKSDVEFVIGNRWEQVYARMIDGEYYPLPAKWYVIQKRWVPYKVNTWQETPLSTKCNGCHTTGFNPDTYEFSEYGIGCEACHGPGSLHVQNQNMDSNILCNVCHLDEDATKGDIINSVNSAVCGQCHSRGKDKRTKDHVQTTYNFPIKYIPGEEIPATFKQSTPKNDKKGKYWWQSGLSKNRHQEFADFSKSNHARALKLLKEKHTDERGELVDDCLRCHSADYIHAPAGQKPSLETAEFGLSCVVCHEPHGMDKHLFPEQRRTDKCGQCHVDSMAQNTHDSGKPHYPGPPGKASCADCHMPYIVKSGGNFFLRSHAFRIVPPIATKMYGMPNSCQNGGCHDDRSTSWAIKEFAKHYPEAAQKAEEAFNKTAEAGNNQ